MRRLRPTNGEDEMKPLEIDVFLCRSDNFGVLLHDPESGATAAIDAPEEGPILQALDGHGWKLTHIFTTHHHQDHVEANLALKDKFGCEVHGPYDEAIAIPVSTARRPMVTSSNLQDAAFRSFPRPVTPQATSVIIFPMTGCCLPPIRCLPWAAAGCSNARRRICGIPSRN